MRHRGYLDPQTKDTAWAHVGTDSSYLALQAPAWDQPPARQNSPYFDHMGFVVDDLDVVVAVLKTYPYRIREIADSPGFKKIYVYIFNGIILELLQYITDDMTVRNRY
ncbi:MAG: hypothetical protein ACI8WB_001216 [Phenylobacterium sp.]